LVPIPFPLLSCSSVSFIIIIQNLGFLNVLWAKLTHNSFE
jgi:hypothetical protein